MSPSESHRQAVAEPGIPVQSPHSCQLEMCCPTPTLHLAPFSGLFLLPCQALLLHINTQLLPQTLPVINSSSRKPFCHSQGVGRKPSFFSSYLLTGRGKEGRGLWGHICDVGESVVT